MSLYSMEYHEGYRAKSVGAYTESLHKFYHASCIGELLKKQDVRLLDICLGGGSNLSVTLDKIADIDTPYKLHIVTVERQASLFETIMDTPYLWPLRGYNILRELIVNANHKNVRLDIAIGDAREILSKLMWSFDVIYFDPFGKRKNPEMWTVEVFRQLHRLCSDKAKVVTYSSGKVIRQDFVAAGFKFTSTPKPEGAFQEGTVFSKE
ncbi:tRNA (5-methylaminomethyl-2-thiouridine)(34)-methyltransferase MnmD [Deferribacteres bacterium DY0037]